MCIRDRLRMLCGEYEHDEGSVFIAKDKTIGMLHQDDAFNVIKVGVETENVKSPVNDTVLGQMYAVFPELVEAEMKLERLQHELDATPAEDTDKDVYKRQPASSRVFLRYSLIL